MTDKEKVKLYHSIYYNRYGEGFADAMKAAGDAIPDYYEYLDTTESDIDCDKELLRLPTADYHMCCVLLTMLLIEDKLDNGAFLRRYLKRQIQPILDKMIELLYEKMGIALSPVKIEQSDSNFVYKYFTSEGSEILKSLIDKGILFKGNEAWCIEGTTKIKKENILRNGIILA